MDYNNKVFTINNKKYLVMDTVILDNKNYVFLINKENEMDNQFKEIIYDGNLILKNIDSELFQEKIYPLFLEKFKNY